VGVKKNHEGKWRKVEIGEGGNPPLFTFSDEKCEWVANFPREKHDGEFRK
jgi:hypothetical protein